MSYHLVFSYVGLRVTTLRQPHSPLIGATNAPYMNNV